jgi:hypothetical protein
VNWSQLSNHCDSQVRVFDHPSISKVVDRSH